MNIKENWNKLSKQRRTIYYWAGLVLLIDLVVTAQNFVQYSQTGQCRNYMIIGSALHSCSAFEFIKSGWAWLSFTNVLIFLPAIATMIFATRIVDVIFTKDKN